MLQKIKRSLLCSTIVLLNTNIWAFSPNPNIPPNIGVSRTLRLAAGESRTLPKNIFYNDLSVKCTAATQDTQCHHVKIENHTDYSCKVNGEETKNGQIDIQICDQISYMITAELLSQITIIHPRDPNSREDSWIELACST